MKNEPSHRKQMNIKKLSVHHSGKLKIGSPLYFFEMQWISILLILPILYLTHCSPKTELSDRDVIFQTTTIAALINGCYDGNLTMKELIKHGDFGLGTFQALNGEMVVYSDTVYQIRYDGKVCHVNGSLKTPFAVVTNYEPDINFLIQESKNLEKLQDHMDHILYPADKIYAIKIHGTFDYVKTRSVPEQKKPYHRLADVIKNQSIFEFRKVEGTVIGFRFPQYLNGINVPGYHFHFLDDTRTCGGHLLDCIIEKGSVQIDVADKLFLMLPENSENEGSVSSKFDQNELDRIEKGK